MSYITVEQRLPYLPADATCAQDIGQGKPQQRQGDLVDPQRCAARFGPRECSPGIQSTPHKPKAARLSWAVDNRESPARLACGIYHSTNERTHAATNPRLICVAI